MNETEFIGNGRNYYKKKFLNLFSFFLDLFLLGVQKQQYKLCIAWKITTVEHPVLKIEVRFKFNLV